MDNLREDFRDWLIKQGLSEKTSSGRPSTVYDYIRRLDKICITIYGERTIETWENLAHHIYLILGFHNLCKNGEIHINRHNLEPVHDFLDDFLFHLSPYQEYLSQYFDVKLLIYKVGEIKYFTVIGYFLPSLFSAKLVLNISTQVKKADRDKNQYVLEKFYRFLSEKNNPICLLGFLKDKAENKDISKEFNTLNTKLVRLKSFHNESSEIFQVIITAGTRKTPPQLTLNRNETKESIAKGIGADEVLDILRITRWTLKRLVDDGQLHKNENNLFDMNEINKFIQDNFHSSVPVDNGSIGDAVKKWWTVKEVKEKTGLNEKYIERLRADKQVSHIKVSNRKYIFYPPDLAIFSKIKPLEW